MTNLTVGCLNVYCASRSTKADRRENQTNKAMVRVRTHDKIINIIENNLTCPENAWMNECKNIVMCVVSLTLLTDSY